MRFSMMGEVLACFFDTKVSHSFLVFLNEACYPSWIRFGVVSQSPANGFIDKEFCLIQIMKQNLFQ